MAVMPNSVDAPPRTAGTPAPARADGNPQRVDVVAVTRRDDLLEQIGHLLDGESAIRPVDSVEAVAGQFVANRAYLVLLDARDCTEIGRAVEQLLLGTDACVVVVFAPSELTSDVASAIRGSAAFAVLPIPIEPGQTAAVLDGAREEALSRLALVAQQDPERIAVPRSVPLVAPAEPQSFPAVMTVRPDLDSAPQSSRPEPVVAVDEAKRRPPPAMLVGGGVLVLLAITIGWYVASRPGPASQAASPPVAADAAPEAPDPALSPQPAPTPVLGTVDELLDRARAAFRDRRYTDPAADSALTYYRSALAQDPENGEAIEGLARIAAVLDERLQSAVSERRTEDAAAILGHLRLAKPGDAGLARLEAELVESQVAAAVESGALERANQLLRNATAARTLTTDRAGYWRAQINGRQIDARARQLAQVVYARIDEGRLVEPEDDSAKFHLAQLRALSDDPSHRAAPTRRLGQAYLQRAQEANAQRQQAEAERWLAEARALGVNAASIAAATAQVATAPVTAAPDSERLARLVQTRIAEGKLLEPREDSALYHMEALRSVDPAGTATAMQARALSERLLEQARSALDARAYDSAQSYLAGARRIGLRLGDVGSLEAALAAAGRTATNVAPKVRTSELKRTRYVAPVYPRAALEDNVSGQVRVRITVDTKGKVTDTEILESAPAGVFDDAALAAVRRWRFKPAEVDGQPVEASTIQSLLFKPGDGT